MKVGARITVATSALVTLTLGAYAFFDLRDSASQRRTDIEHEAREIAYTLRASLESRGIDGVVADSKAISEQLNHAGTPWTATILPRAIGLQPESITEEQRKRLQAIIELPEVHLTLEERDRLIYVVQLRRPSLSAPTGFDVVGALELERPIAHLDDALTDDVVRTLSVMAIVVVLTIFAVTWLTRSLMTKPVEKLLAGIDEVAQGDLTRVLLSERDDEIGALATRFNEMTFSLRESQAETQRHNDAKLKLEQRLGQTEKLATIGQLAAEIAHEVGTPLNVIAGRAKGMTKKASDAEAVKKNAGIIAEQTARITRIIQRLLDFTRRKVGTSEPSVVNLNEVSFTTMELLEGQFAAAKVKTTLARAEALPSVKGDADRLQQVLLNLLLNAIQAMPEGGTLRCETGTDTRRRPGLERAPEQVYVHVDVTDSGVGIPPDVRDKIFEPFYTSKEGRGGTGLGLSVCYGIVKEHDGWIEIDDAAQGGTVFRVFLPAA